MCTFESASTELTCPFPQAVKRFLKQECKCHGVSGSCTLRTCWLAMADFRKTGNYLWRKYNGAIQVVMNQDGTGFTVANKRFKKPTKNDLVYFENSPDYCIRDRDAGKFKTLYSKYLILLRISTPQFKCSTVFSTCQSSKCSLLSSGSKLRFFSIHILSAQKSFPKQLEKFTDNVQILEKWNPTRMYVAKSQNVQISKSPQPGQNSNWWVHVHYV